MGAKLDGLFLLRNKSRNPKFDGLPLLRHKSRNHEMCMCICASWTATKLSMLHIYKSSMQSLGMTSKPF